MPADMHSSRSLSLALAVMAMMGTLLPCRLMVCTSRGRTSSSWMLIVNTPHGMHRMAEEHVRPASSMRHEARQSEMTT